MTDQSVGLAGEFVKMRVGPAHHNLDNLMQGFKRSGLLHLHLAPDEWFGVQQADFKLNNVVHPSKVTK